MSKLLYEHVFAAGGFSGETFDIAAGPANTGIIDTLLSAGDGALTANAPHVLVSSGVLGAPRTLDLSAMEVENLGAGSQALKGRFFYLSVQNTDILVNHITVIAGTSINTLGSLVIDHANDFLFHHSANGVWRVNVLPQPAQTYDTASRVPFAATDWSSNTLTVIQTGTPGAGQVGPHNLTAHNSYLVQIINTDLSPEEKVEVEVQFDVSGNVTLRKAPRAPDFAGIAILSGTLD